MHTYPPAPWTLRGHAIAVPLLVRLDPGRIPPPLAAASAGGRTPGLAIAAWYGPGSTLRYSELAIVVAVRHGVRPGGYVIGLWVDDAASVAGGGSIWGLPKELARFRWCGASGVAMRAAGGGRARLAQRPVGPTLPLPAPLPLRVFVVRAGAVESFRAWVRGRVRAARPVRGFTLPQPLRVRPAGLALEFGGLEVRTAAPRPI